MHQAISLRLQVLVVQIMLFLISSYLLTMQSHVAMGVFRPCVKEVALGVPDEVHCESSKPIAFFQNGELLLIYSNAFEVAFHPFL